jgi:hypothetical protein
LHRVRLACRAGPVDRDLQILLTCLFRSRFRISLTVGGVDLATHRLLPGPLNRRQDVLLLLLDSTVSQIHLSLDGSLRPLQDFVRHPVEVGWSIRRGRQGFVHHPASDLDGGVHVRRVADLGQDLAWSPHGLRATTDRTSHSPARSADQRFLSPREEHVLHQRLGRQLRLHGDVLGRLLGRAFHELRPGLRRDRAGDTGVAAEQRSLCTHPASDGANRTADGSGTGDLRRQLLGELRLGRLLVRPGFPECAVVRGLLHQPGVRRLHDGVGVALPDPAGTDHGTEAGGSPERVPAQSAGHPTRRAEHAEVAEDLRGQFRQRVGELVLKHLQHAGFAAVLGLRDQRIQPGPELLPVVGLVVLPFLDELRQGLCRPALRGNETDTSTRETDGRVGRVDHPVVDLPE